MQRRLEIAGVDPNRYSIDISPVKIDFRIVSKPFLVSPGASFQYLSTAQTKLIWCGYWVGLGILSSVGLGTGLHTFLLYLGPHIASVTLAAYECNSLDFPQPPYPEQ